LVFLVIENKINSSGCPQIYGHPEEFILFSMTRKTKMDSQTNTHTQKDMKNVFLIHMIHNFMDILGIQWGSDAKTRTQ